MSIGEGSVSLRKFSGSLRPADTNASTFPGLEKSFFVSEADASLPPSEAGV